MSSQDERRLAPRYAVSVAVTFESEHNFFTGLTQDLSKGGLFVATHAIRPIGESIRVRLTLPTSSEPIDAITEVRWIRPQDLPGGAGEAGMGLMFLQLTPKGKAAIKEFLSKRDSLFYDLD
jgi:uncharacterized protein (TIGR02266 family)